MKRGPRRRGFALAVAVCTLAALAGLAAAAIYTVLEARRAANRAARQDQAAAAADAGLRWALDSWGVPRAESLGVGRTDSGGPSLVAGDLASPVVRVTRITRGVLSITSAGIVAAGSSVEALRARTLLVEALRPAFTSPAVLTSRGDVRATTAAQFTTVDAPPPGWSDCAPEDTTTIASVVVPEGNVARLDDGRPIDGAALSTVAADPSTYLRLGRVSISGLSSRADVELGPGARVAPAPDLANDCRLDAVAGGGSNWGEPARTGKAPGCEAFRPVVHAKGDLTVTGGRGQGILIVGGRLRIEGPFRYAGVVHAAGGIEVTGDDVAVYGAVMSGGTEGVAWHGAGEVSRSACAVSRAAASAARLYPLPARAWAELF